jgi:hypothetical protein
MRADYFFTLLKGGADLFHSLECTPISRIVVEVYSYLLM